MAKKPPRHDPEAVPLTSNPFAALGGLVKEPLPEGDAPPAPKPKKAAPPPFSVGKSKKGNYAIAIERRSGGKTVTILDKVSGDGKGLLKALKARLGTGGALKEGRIELQGDHRAVLEDALLAILR